MKKIAALQTLLLLTSCAAPEPEIAGKLVPCASLATGSVTNPIQLGCLDGSEGVAINALKGPMLINVWGSWCAACKAEMGYFRAFYERAQGKVELVGIDVEEASIKNGQDFVLTHGMTWPNLYDGDGSSRAYFGMGVPVTWFIAPDGSTAHKKIGEIKSEEELIALTKKYLGIEL